MIKYTKFQLENGLTVIFHQDKTTPMAVVNTLYNVGARDETFEKTGFAHLFEHLMFGGSVNIPEFDTPLQLAGGENNAFTSNDITNYYDVVPKQNIETALWLESDRMLSLAFTPKSLEVQRSVVIEEFKQRYLNQPYGNTWLLLRELAYTEHPYRWATIGREISHIEQATMEDVKAFFKKYYCPSNAILCIAGDFELDEIKNLVTKWYGDIPAGEKIKRNLPQEPKQTEYREKIDEQKVPSDAFYYAFKMCDRLSEDYHTTDILSDWLGADNSSKLYTKIKKELKLVTSISASQTGSIDAGLFVISGKLAPNVTFEQLDAVLWEQLAEVKKNPINENELTRLKNKIKTAKAFQDKPLLNKAMNLCFYELLGDIELINKELNAYDKISAGDLHRVANEILHPTNCSTLKIKAKI
ncbi:MAG TPA: pitrilysin family protein [Crocinitomicaceae bacterium]|nr:pitrilysin family protein [Crocinitomicaceae bacterium]